MKIVSNKSKIGIVVLSLLTSLGVSLSSPTSANASTDCQTAQREATGRALSLGDSATAASARSMCVSFIDHSNYGLVLQKCDAINNFYVRYSAYLQSTRVSGVILDAYESCLTDNAKRVRDFLDSAQPAKPKFKLLKAPKVIGTAKVGKTLSVQKGSWSGKAQILESHWFVCKSQNTKSQAKTDWRSGGKFGIPANTCGNPVEVGSKFKILSKYKYKGKYILVCQTVDTKDELWGYNCSPTVKIS